MNGASHLTALVRNVESLISESFRKEPFHNLNLIYGGRLHTPLPGGTCSDKTLSFIDKARQEGFDVFLHSGFIGGLEIHRLARLHIGGQVFFADVGNGWPALRLYPADRNISFRAFGMGFRTEVTKNRVTVFHEKNGKESLQLEIHVQGRSQDEIMTDIDRRFNSGVVYPFSNSLRFSSVVGKRFCFFRGDKLQIYSDDKFEEIEGIEDDQVPEIIHRYFGYEIRLGLCAKRLRY